MAKQSRLEQEALDTRKELTIKNDYSKNNEYSLEHEDTKTHYDEEHAHGKGTGHGGHTHVVPNPKKSRFSIEKSQFDTENGGGSFDIYGMGNVGGRNRLQAINIYGPNNQYGVDSIDTSKNFDEGQYRVK